VVLVGNKPFGVLGEGTPREMPPLHLIANLLKVYRESCSWRRYFVDTKLPKRWLEELWVTAGCHS
jgi:hypothetical protein